MDRICEVEGCMGTYYLKGMCAKHYWRRNRGHIGRTVRDPNEFVIEGDICIIPLYDIKCNKIAEAVIDAEDYEKCRPYKWHGSVDSGGNMRVCSSKAGSLPSVILGFIPSNSVVGDHIDGNTLDNRKSNLQIITQQQNTIKQKMAKNNVSGYRGVTWYPRHSKWSAQIRYSGVKYFLGYFDDKNEAAKVRNEKAKELFGRFAVLNVIPQNVPLGAY